MIFAENNSNSSGELEGAEPEAGESTSSECSLYTV